MTRRNYNNQKRKRHRCRNMFFGGNGNEHKEENTNNHNNNKLTTTLEEDLQQQRIRQQQQQQQQQQQREQEKEKQFKAVIHDEDEMHEIILDDDEGFDQSTIDWDRTNPLHQQWMYKTGVLSSETSSSLSSFPASVALGYVQQSGSSLTLNQQTRIRPIWHSQYLLENMKINNRATAFYSKKLKWLNRTLPNGINCSWDMTCKHRLHPSARTFDVAMVKQDNLPTISTIVEGGWSQFHIPNKYHLSTSSIVVEERWGQRRIRETRQPSNDRSNDGIVDKESVHTRRCAPVHAIRIHESTGRCGVVARSRAGPYQFQFYPSQYTALYMDVNLDLPVTDFCFGKDLVIFSCPRYHSKTTLSPLFLPFDNDIQVTGNYPELRTLNVRNFPQSDALRVEMTCDHNDKYVAFGHRNGQVSLLDLRASNTICSILQQESDTGTPLGSVSDLAFLSSPHYSNTTMIVKRSFGSCQMHDLRMSSTNSSQTNYQFSSSSVLQNLIVPADEINSTLSANCNGFAVDPSGKQTLISPYINTNRDACLGVWSLRTGRMVGCRILHKNYPEFDAIHVELCQKATPSFSSTVYGEKSESSFALWLKCGAFTKGKVSSKVGNLHQISFPGQWQ